MSLSNQPGPETLLAAVLSGLPTPVAWCDAAGALLGHNHGFASLVDEPTADLTGRRLAELAPRLTSAAVERLGQLLTEAMETGETQRCGLVVPDRDGVARRRRAIATACQIEGRPACCLHILLAEDGAARPAPPPPANADPDSLLETNQALALLSHISRLAASCRTGPDLADRLAHALRAALPVDAFFLDVLVDEPEQVRALGNYDLIEGVFQRCRPSVPSYAQPNSPLHAQLLEHREPVLIQDEETELPQRDRLSTFGDSARLSASLLFLPVFHSARLIGVMSIQSYRPSAYQLADVGLMRDVCHQIAPSLEGILLAERLAVQTERLAESEGRFASFMDQLPAVACLIDEQGQPVWCNAYQRERFGASTVCTRLALSMRGDVAVTQLHEVTDLAGESRLIEYRGFPVVGRHGRRLLGLIGFDITEQEAQAAASRRLATAVEQAAETVVVTDTEGLIQYVNPAFERITGYTREEALGQNPRILKSNVHPLSFYESLWAIISSGQTWRGSLVNQRKDGTLYHEEASISPVRDADGQITNYVAVKRDVTEERQLAEQLRQAAKMEAVGRLAGGVAHDFNNRLTAIAGYAELLQDSLKPGDPRREDVTEILSAAARAAELTSQLLAFSRHRASDNQPSELDVVLARMTMMLERLLGSEVSMVVETGAAGRMVGISVGQIEQIVINLAVNARDAMPGGGELLLSTSHVAEPARGIFAPGAEAVGPCLVFTVADTGSGMDPATRDRVFEPFFTTKPDGHGTGLGLPIVYGIVTQAGGAIVCESQPGQGTRFEVYLPEVAAGAGAAEGPAAGARELVGGHESILLAEDEDAIRDLAARALEQLGYTVHRAANGADALALLDRLAEPPDLLVTDIAMPGLRGDELAVRVVARHPGLPVLYISGFADRSAWRDAPQAGPTRFLQKPFGPAELGTTVRELLDLAAL